MTHAEKEKRNILMREYKAEGRTAREVADKFGVSRGTAQTICKGVSPQRARTTPVNKGTIQGDDKVAIFIAKHCKGFEYAGNYTGADGRADVKCIECGTVINRSMISIRHNNCTCPTCYEKAKAEREKVKERAKTLKAHALKERRTKAEASQFNKGSQLVFKTCPTCGGLFYKAGSKYCSRKCADKFNNDLKERRRRAKLQEALVDRDINLHELFKINNGVCAICGKRCNWDDYELKGDNVFIAGDNYPSIDHIKPLAKGGLHSWGNVQLAHRICNSLKADGISPC